MIEDHARDIDIMQPFLRHRAIDAGLSDAQLRSSAFTQLVWGVHVSAEVPIDNYLMCKAALLAVPEASICGRSAARLWGAIVPDSADVEVLLDRKHRTLGGRLALSHDHRRHPAARVASQPPRPPFSNWRANWNSLISSSPETPSARR